MSNIDPNLTDPACVTGPNLSFYPIGSAQHLDPNYNILPFLCDLLKMSTDPNATGLFTDPVTPFDITPFTDFSPLTSIGDPRVSLGQTMTQTYINFLPRMITQTEVRQAGGSQVIDNYICTADGTPIKQSSTTPILLSLDLTGHKTYKYGAITVPPVSATFEELMKPIDPKEVIAFVKEYVAAEKNSNADAFVYFINSYFPKYTKQIDVYQTLFSMIVTLSDNNGNNVYLKYFPDVAVKVACLLEIPNINQHVSTSSGKNDTMADAISSKIPDYTKFITDKIAADEWYIYVMSKFKDSGKTDYPTLLSIPDNFVSHVKTVFAAASSNIVTQKYNTTSVPCSSV